MIFLTGVNIKTIFIVFVSEYVFYFIVFIVEFCSKYFGSVCVDKIKLAGMRKFVFFSPFAQNCGIVVATEFSREQSILVCVPLKINLSVLNPWQQAPLGVTSRELLYTNS